MMTDTTRLTAHCLRRLAERQIVGEEVGEALGCSWKSRRDGVLVFESADDLIAAPGSPIVIGRGRNHHGPTALLLGKASKGRPLHLAVGSTAGRLDVLTAWDPSSPEICDRWLDGYQVPTRFGARTLPPQRWLRGEPGSRRGFAPHPSRPPRDVSGGKGGRR